MTDQKKNFWLGLFILSALIIAIILLLFLHPTAGDGKKIVRVRFSNLEKVTLGTRVTFAGKPVGEVVAIKEIKEARNNPPDASGNPYFYEVELKVDSGVHLYNYDEVAFSTVGLLGEKVIAIVPKNAPKNRPAPEPIPEDKILDARSSDKIEDALVELTHIARTLDSFFEENREKLSSAISSFGRASQEAGDLLSDLNREETGPRFAHMVCSADHVFSQILESNMIGEIHSITSQIASREGTLGKLIYDDHFYLKTQAVMSQLELALNNINRYGLLFQFNNCWQKKERMRRCKMVQMANPCDFYNYFQEEIQAISLSLDKLREIMVRLHCKEPVMDNGPFAHKYRELLNQVEGLSQDLKLYNEKMVEIQ